MVSFLQKILEDTKRSAERELQTMKDFVEREREEAKKSVEREREAVKQERETVKELVKHERETVKELVERERALWLADKVRLEVEFAIFKSKYDAVLTMRPIFELGVLLLAAKRKLTASSVTAKYDALKLTLVKPNNGLGPFAASRLKELDEKTDNGVGAALNQMYARLSEDVHNVKVVNLSTGLVCGGSFPVRAALAIALMYFQEEGVLFEDIIYTDENFEPSKILRGGHAVPYVPPTIV
jgi:hypothetical protein